MQIIRLVQTILILINRKKVTAAELADRFNVSVRSIYRDIDALSLAGIPVYSVKGKGGGIYLGDSFHIDETLINQDEQQDILIALNLLKSTGFIDNEKLLRKLEDLYGWSDWITVDFKHSGGVEEALFQQIKQAIFQECKVRFTYYTCYGQTRLIETIPRKLIFKNQQWLLAGIDINGDAVRTYALERIRKLELLAKHPCRKMVVADEIELETITVTLRFSKRISYKKYDDFRDYQIINNDDSSYDIKMEFSGMPELYAFLLPLGKNVKILEPEAIRRDVLAHINSFYTNNL